MADEKFRVDGGFIATGNSKITGTLDLTGTILNVGANSDIANKGYVDQVVDNALVGVELGAGSVAVSHGIAAADWGETMEWTVKNNYTKAGTHGILTYTGAYTGFGFGVGFSKDGTTMVVAGNQYMRVYTWDSINEVWTNTHHLTRTDIGNPQAYNNVIVSDDGTVFVVRGSSKIVSYVKSGSTWNTALEFGSSSTAVGCGLSADGLTLIVGQNQSSAVHKYTRASVTSGWSSAGSIQWPDPNGRGWVSSLSWGRAIALNSDGTKMAVSAPGDDTYLESTGGWSRRGRVYIMEVSSGAVLQVLEIPDTLPDVHTNMGIQMVASDDLSTIVLTSDKGLHCFKQNESGVWNWISEWRPTEDFWGNNAVFPVYSLSMSADGRTITTSTQSLRTSMFTNSDKLPYGFAYIVTQSSGLLTTRARMSPDVGDPAAGGIYGYGNHTAISRDGNTIASVKGGNMAEVGAIGEYVYINKKVQVQI